MYNIAGNSFTLYLTEYNERIETKIIDFLKTISHRVIFDKQTGGYHFAPKATTPYCLFYEHDFKQDTQKQVLYKIGVYVHSEYSAC